MIRRLIITIVFIAAIVFAAACKNKKTPEIKSQQYSEKPFEYTKWIDSSISRYPFTEAQATAVKEILETVFYNIENYTEITVSKNRAWKKLRRRKRSYINNSEPPENDELFSKINGCLYDSGSDISFKNIELFINISIDRFNEENQTEILHSIFLQRIPNKPIINPEIAKRIFSIVEEKKVLIKDKQLSRKTLESAYLYSYICSGYADSFEDQQLFEQLLSKY